MGICNSLWRAYLDYILAIVNSAFYPFHHAPTVCDTFVVEVKLRFFDNFCFGGLGWFFVQFILEVFFVKEGFLNALYLDCLKLLESNVIRKKNFDCRFFTERVASFRFKSADRRTSLVLFRILLIQLSPVVPKLLGVVMIFIFRIIKYLGEYFFGFLHRTFFYLLFFLANLFPGWFRRGNSRCLSIYRIVFVTLLFSKLS